MRKTEIQRKTKETDISLSLNIDGKGSVMAETGIGFFDHMIQALGRHGFMDIDLKCQGDLHVDQHHTVEDVGIVLGKAIKEALGEKKGIKRFGSVFTPMDEALSLVAMDLSGRAFLNYDVGFTQINGNFDYTLLEEFFRAVVNHAEITLHIKLEYGKNHHHMAEAIFKGFGRALDEATLIQDRIDGVVSTKGVL